MLEFKKQYEDKVGIDTDGKRIYWTTQFIVDSNEQLIAHRTINSKIYKIPVKLKNNESFSSVLSRVDMFTKLNDDTFIDFDRIYKNTLESIELVETE